MAQVNSEISGDDKKLQWGEGSIMEKKRGCTDVLILLLIIACWFVMTIVGFAAIGIIKSDVILPGDPYRLTHAMDYEGNICGSGDYDDRPMGYYMPDKSCVCISECPTKTYDSPTTSSEIICKYGVAKTLDFDILQSSSPNYYLTNILNNNCMIKLASDTQFYRCVPTGAAALAYEAFASSQNTGTYSTEYSQKWYQAFVSDVFEYQGYVFGFGIGVAALVALIYLYLLRIPGLLSIIIWSLILSIEVALWVGAWLLWSLAIEWDGDGVHDAYQVEIMEVFSYVFMGLASLYLFLIFVLGKRVALAIGIVKEATRAMGSMPLLTCLPLLQTIGCVAFLVPWVIYIFYMASSGEVSKDPITGNRTFEYSDDQKYAFLYMLFCWFWTSEFIIAIGQLVIALCFCAWYFTKDKKEIGNKTISWAIKTTFWNHLGTVAFGSLVIAIIQTIRAVISYFEKQAKKSKNKVVEYLLCMIQCCMWCVEKCMKFLNKNAYIQTAIYGTNFCKSARQAFFLILRNILRVAAVSMVGDFVLLIGKLFIPIMTTFVCYLCMAYGIDSSELNGIISPLIFVAILSYFIAAMFTEIFGMGIETILCCFIADEEMFSPDQRYAEGDLSSAIQKTNQAAAVKVAPETAADVKPASSNDEVLV